MATQFGKIPGKYDVIKRKKGQELTAPVFTSGQTVDPMAAPVASTTNPPTDELVAKVPSYKISKLPGSNLMSQLQANTSKMQSDLSEVDKNSTVQKQFSLLQQLERTIVDPVDRAKFEQDKANIEAQYQSAKGSKEGARAFTLIAEGLANIAGGLIASNKGIGYSPVKFEGIDWDKQITRLQDESAQQKGDVDKSLASAMMQQTQSQDLADKQYSDKANILGTGIQIGQAEDTAKRNQAITLQNQLQQGTIAGSQDEFNRQQAGTLDTQKKSEYDYRTFNDAENRKLQRDKIDAAAKAAALKASAKGEGKKELALMNTRNGIMDMKTALQGLKDGGVTGLIEGTFGAAWDRVAGNPEAQTRLLLHKLRVDDALTRVANTKGAISDAEMKLFLAPTPRQTDDEAIWEQWIKDRLRVAEKVEYFNETGKIPPADFKASFEQEEGAPSVGSGVKELQNSNYGKIQGKAQDKDLNNFTLMEDPKTGERANVHKSAVDKYLKMKYKVVGG